MCAFLEAMTSSFMTRKIDPFVYIGSISAEGSALVCVRPDNGGLHQISGEAGR
jgi:hypothetical protein